MKKRILFVVESLGGGVLTYIVTLANKLVEVFDICIAYGVREQTPADFQQYFNDQICFIRVENFSRSISLVKDLKSFYEIRDIAKKVKPDIIHLHSSKAGALGRFAFNGRKIPVFYTPHGYSFLMQDQSTVKRMAYKVIEFICGRRSCVTISCSEGEHRASIKVAKKATYVNNGIDIKELQGLLDSVNEDESRPFTVFTLGRICPQKNPAMFNQIAMALPSTRFLWIGDGELRNELTAENIKITGWVSREEALKAAMNADVFVLTSLWEGLPMSLLEAMYMKKLCVVSNVIGNRDVIHNGQNGFVCNCIEEYMRGIEIAREGTDGVMIDRAYADVLDQYNTEAMTQRYAELYTQYMQEISLLQ